MTSNRPRIPENILCAILPRAATRRALGGALERPSRVVSPGGDGRADYGTSETEIIAGSEAGNVVASAVVVNPAAAGEIDARATR
jgi:hypothetical protein